MMYKPAAFTNDFVGRREHNNYYEIDIMDREVEDILDGKDSYYCRSRCKSQW